MGSCLDAGIVVGLSEGGIVVVGGNVVVKALGGKVDVVVCMCGNVAMGGIVGISGALLGAFLLKNINCNTSLTACQQKNS